MKRNEDLFVVKSGKAYFVRFENCTPYMTTDIKDAHYVNRQEALTIKNHLDTYGFEGVVVLEKPKKEYARQELTVDVFLTWEQLRDVEISNLEVKIQVDRFLKSALGVDYSEGFEWDIKEYEVNGEISPNQKGRILHVHILLEQIDPYWQQYKEVEERLEVGL